MIKKEDVFKYIGCYPDGSSKSEIDINTMVINKSTGAHEIMDNIITNKVLLNIYADRLYTTLTLLFQDEERARLSETHKLLSRYQDAMNSYDENSITFTALNVAVVPQVINEHHFITGNPFFWYVCSSDIDGKTDTIKFIFKNESIYTLSA